MRSAILLLVFGLLVFGCVGPSEDQVVVNISQNQSGGTVVNITQNASNDQAGSGNQTAGAIPSQEINYLTSDSWKIFATFYPAKNAVPKTGIMLLHQLGSDRTSFDQLIPILHEAVPDADILAIDSRGHGKSTNLGTHDKFILGDYRAMANDVKGAVDYLSFYRHMSGNFYIVGASIGSTTAINYAELDSSIQRIVMLSPGMDYQGVDIKTALGRVKKKVYIAVAEGDEQSATDAQTVYALSNAYTKEIFVYKSIDAAHGTDMLAQSALSKTEQPLALKIANWLE